MVKVLAFDGISRINGDIYGGVYGHILGTDYTYRISAQGPDNIADGNYISRAGNGFIYRGYDTSGSDDGLVYSSGTGSTLLLNDENGNFINDPGYFSQFGDQSVFVARSASVSTSYPSKTLMMTNDGGAPEILLNQPVDNYYHALNKIWAVTDVGDLYSIEQDGSISLLYDRSASATTYNFHYIFEFQGEVYIRAGTPTLQGDFFKIDPNSGAMTRLFIGVKDGGADTFYWWGNAAVADSQFFFWSNHEAGTGTELFVSDGTTAGTHIVKDILPGTSSSYLLGNTTPIAVGNKIFFVADDGGSDDEELWVSDGTTAGTFALSGSGTSVGALGFNFMDSIELNGGILFTASAGTGEELFYTDGTIAGTRLVKEINTQPSPFPEDSSPTFWVADDGFAYFAVSNADGPDDHEVWVTDGTAAGTRALSNTADETILNLRPSMFNIVDIDIDNIPTQTLTGTPEDDELRGTFLNEIIIGDAGNDDVYDGAGADDVFLGAGNDYVRVGTGQDNYDGGTGRDFISYYDSTGGITIDLAANTVTGSWANNDTIKSFEGFSGSNTGNDDVRGTSGSNHIYTHGGDDRVNAGGGDDNVFLGAGNDYVRVGTGQDNYDGGTGRDFISYYDSTGGITINLAANTVTGSWANNDTIKSFEGFSGSKSGNDDVRGTSGSNHIFTHGGDDRVNAGGGDDNVHLGAGNDYVRVGTGQDNYDGGTGLDFISYYDSTGGITIDLAANTVTGSWANNDTIKSFEGFSGSNTGNDYVRGTSGSNLIYTHGGDDRVYAGGGDDNVHLGAGNDYVRAGTGQDDYDGGTGRDFISYYDSTGGITIDLAANTVTGSWANNDTIKSFEGVSGSNIGGDVIYGTAGANTLYGYGGDDVLYGRSGNDSLFGGGGADELFGGAGSDAFHFDFGEGHDTIKDFENNIDVIELGNTNYANASAALSDATQIGNDVVFDFGVNGMLTVEDTTIALLLNDIEIV